MRSTRWSIRAGDHDYADAGNIHKLIDLEFGDVEPGLAQADVVREDVFFFEGNTHLPMEQHARWPTVPPLPTGSSRCGAPPRRPHYVHRALAKVLEPPGGTHPRDRLSQRGRLRREERSFSHEIVAAKLAMLTAAR